MRSGRFFPMVFAPLLYRVIPAVLLAPAFAGDETPLAKAVTELAQGASAMELDAAIKALASIRAHVAHPNAVLPPVMAIHKHTYATADPEAAVAFVAAHLGGVGIQRPDHSCPAGSKAAGVPLIRDLTLAGAVSDLALHFVFNPNKSPGTGKMNATEIGKYVDKLRGHFGTNGIGKFDQFMDNHIGAVVSSLDPYVASWQEAGLPFICRTWCCAEGMPQYPQKCPAYSLGRESGCEVGCYVEIPYGIIFELQCGLTSYNESLGCLTRVQPEVFDLCRVESAVEYANVTTVFA